MPVDFTQEQTDMTAIYTDAASQPAPEDALLSQIKDATSAPSVPPTPADPTAPVATPAPAAPAGAAAPAPATPATPGTPAGAAPAAVATPSGPNTPAAQALLTRLGPMGITSLEQLKGKTNAELSKLSLDTVTYETRQSSLSQNFAKLPDGSFDWTKGPDGSPTGLGPDGKPIPPAAPAPAPGTTTPPAVPPAGAPAAGAPAAAKPKDTNATSAYKKAYEKKHPGNSGKSAEAAWDRDQAKKAPKPPAAASAPVVTPQPVATPPPVAASAPIVTPPPAVTELPPVQPGTNPNKVEPKGPKTAMIGKATYSNEASFVRDWMKAHKGMSEASAKAAWKRGH